MGGGRFLIVCGGGREAAFAVRLAEDVSLYAVLPHENPLIIDRVTASGGEYMVGSADDPRTVLEFARRHGIDYAFVNSDRPLASGVVDALLDGGIRPVGGTREAARMSGTRRTPSG